MHQLAGSADKELLLFEGALHVLSMETNREDVFDCISSWISNRSEGRTIRESDSGRAVPAVADVVGPAPVGLLVVKKPLRTR